METTNQKLETQISKLKHGSSNESETFKKEIRVLEHKLKELQEKHDTLKTSTSKIQKKLVAFEIENENLGETNRRQQMEIDELTVQLNAATEKCIMLESENQEKVSRMDNEIEHCKQTIREYQDEINCYKNVGSKPIIERIKTDHTVDPRQSNRQTKLLLPQNEIENVPLNRVKPKLESKTSILKNSEKDPQNRKSSTNQGLERKVTEREIKPLRKTHVIREVQCEQELLEAEMIKRLESKRNFPAKRVSEMPHSLVLDKKYETSERRRESNLQFRFEKKNTVIDYPRLGLTRERKEEKGKEMIQLDRTQSNMNYVEFFKPRFLHPKANITSNIFE